LDEKKIGHPSAEEKNEGMNDSASKHGWANFFEKISPLIVKINRITVSIHADIMQFSKIPNFL